MTQKQTIGNVPRSMAMIRSVALALAVTMPLTAPLPGVNASEKELPTKLVDTFEQGRGVVTLALNPDGTLMASGNSDTTIQLWDLARQRVIATLPGHAKTVDHVAFSADGKTLFSASKEDGVVKLWDVAARKNLATLNYPKRYIHALASSKDGKLLAVATGDTIQLVDIATSKSAGSLGKKGDGTGSGPMAFSSDGKTLVAGPRLRGGALADSGKVKVWDVEGGKLKSTFRVERFDEFRDSWWVSPDGKSAVAIKLSGLDRIIRMETWDTATGELKQTTDFGKGNKREYTRAVLVDGGKTLVGFSDKATFWDAEKQEITAELASLGGRGIRVAVSGDGKSVAGWGNNVLVLDVSGPKRKAEMVGGMHGHPRGLFFSSDGKVLTSSYEEFSYFWEVGTGKYLFNIPLTLSGVNSAADNKTFFCSVGGSRWQSRFFVHESGTPLHIDDFFVGKDLVLDKTETQFGVIRCMASTRDGKTLAAGFDGHNTIRIWNVAGLKIEKRKVEGEVFTGVKTVQILKGHADEVRMVTFSEDGKRLASTSVAGEFKLWDVEAGKELSTLLLAEAKEKADVGNMYAQGTPVAISRDFKTLALGTRTGEVKLWDVASGKVLATRQILKDKAVTAVALSVDGKLLATAGGDNTVQVWDVASGKNLAALTGHTGVVQFLSFSPVDPILASMAAGSDNSIKLWELIPGK